ncbi:MAG: hypothetical protein ABIH65_04005 [Nanoarchaeota archaeon]
MEECRREGFLRILNNYKIKNKRVLIITQQDFCYTADILEIYSDAVLFQDKFGKEVLLEFSQIKQIGGSPKEV